MNLHCIYPTHLFPPKLGCWGVNSVESACHPGCGGGGGGVWWWIGSTPHDRQIDSCLHTSPEWSVVQIRTTKATTLEIHFFIQ